MAETRTLGSSRNIADMCRVPAGSSADALLSLDEDVLTPGGPACLYDLWRSGALRPCAVHYAWQPDRFFVRLRDAENGWHGWRVHRPLWEMMVAEMPEGDAPDEHTVRQKGMQTL